MRILLDPGVYDMRNKGNVAMLLAAVGRFQALWPDATIGVITVSPQVLRLYCPGVVPVAIDDQPDWSRFNSKSNSLQQRIPGFALRALFELRESIWQRWPSLKSKLIGQSLTAAKEADNDQPQPAADDSSGDPAAAAERKQIRGVSVQGADLFVATGGGIMCDIAMEHAFSVFDRLEAAVALGKPTVMVGQGIGPIQDADMLARAKAVFPSVDFIAVREKRAAPDLLASYSVEPARVMVSGDDAVEMTYAERSGEPGNGIGLNLRFMGYTGVNNDHIRILREVIHREAGRVKAGLVSLPISYDLREVDAEATRLLMQGYPRIKDVSRRMFDPPLALIQRARECRLVITGAYHTAVFALSQGVPAICLAKSYAYREKFLGLADLFQPGCRVIDLDDEHLDQKLNGTIQEFWSSASTLRPALLHSAENQIAAGQAAYRHIYDLYTTGVSVALPAETAPVAGDGNS